MMSIPNSMIESRPGWVRNWNRAVFVLFLSLASCMFETKYVDPDQPGYLNLELRLQPNHNALLKTASADTIFSVDSLIVVLSAAGATTATYNYGITGRSDTANIAVAARIYALASLRTWTAKILTIDTSLNPSRRDTVHLDSITFTVNPGDTAFVSKAINPLFSILRARLVSNAPASITNTVKYVRIRVDGTTRDSMMVGPAYRYVSFGNSNTGCAVGDSGNIIRTTNSGANWVSAASGTTQNLRCVDFPSTNTGFAAGAGGTVVKTTNGTSWSAITSGTTQNLNGTYWTGTSNGWIVGDAGTIRKSANGTSFTAQTSGTTQNLNSVYFTTTNNGNAVGNTGTILRSTNGGTNWSAQTSGTVQNLNAVFFPAAATGFAVGDNGTILKTTNSGANWAALSSGTTANLNGVFFTSSTSGYVVGDGGVLLTTSDGTSWTPRTSGTTENLYGIGWTTNSSAVVAVGGMGAVTTSTTGTAWTKQWIGTKSFDVYLTYKYFAPGISHTVLMDAIDTVAGTLRGYQVSKTVLLAPGKDSTLVTSSLVKCGYSGFSACTP
ncbi:MAG: YCF48-related protein [Fibrobacteria bacterium]